MNLLTSIPFIKPKLRNPQQITSTFWSDRKQILDENVNLFCWQRGQNQQVTLYLQKIIARDLAPLTVNIDMKDLGHKLSESRKLWDAEHSEEADAFWIDVYRLSKDFLSLSVNANGMLHLRIVNNNACSRFHTDGYALRLFTTYYGKGTEWLPESATNRKGLGKINELIVKDPSQVQQMESFEVGILKGELPNRLNSTPGIVHRSPEIEHTGEKRVILRIDI